MFGVILPVSNLILAGRLVVVASWATMYLGMFLLHVEDSLILAFSLVVVLMIAYAVYLEVRRRRKGVGFQPLRRSPTQTNSVPEHP